MKTQTQTTVVLLDDNRELVARILGADLLLNTAIKRQREDWLEYGKRLSELRQQYPGKKNDLAFGNAVKDAGLGGIERSVRSDAIWFYENKDMCRSSDTSLHHPTLIRRAFRAEQQESAEVIDIKFQESVGQVVPVQKTQAQVAEELIAELKKPVIPECPYPYACQWNGKEWVRVHRKEPEPEQETPAMLPRTWLVNYIRDTSDANIKEIFKALRRIEHPDKGGNPQTAAVIGQYLETYFSKE